MGKRKSPRPVDISNANHLKTTQANLHDRGHIPSSQVRLRCNK